MPTSLLFTMSQGAAPGSGRLTPQVVVPETPRDKRFTNKPNEYKNSQGSPRHNWNKENRQVLCLLFYFYETDLDAFTAIFNEMFDHTSPPNGPIHVFRPEPLSWQFRWMEAGHKGHDIYKSVFQPTSKETCTRFISLRNTIEAVARRLRISLQARNAKRTKKSRKRRQFTPSTISDGFDSILLETTDEEDRPSPKRSRYDLSQRDLGSGTSNFIADKGIRTKKNKGPFAVLRSPEDGNMEEGRRIPRLLYRFTDGNSRGSCSRDGLIAGKFVGADSLPFISSHDTERDQFHDAIVMHLHRLHQPTPFISFYSRLRPALHRALKSSLNSMITIVDSDKLRERQRVQFGFEQGAVFSSKDLIHEHVTSEKAALPGQYKGGTEWLVWGRVPPEAIVCQFHTSEIWQQALEHPQLEKILQLDVIKAAKWASLLGKKLTPQHLSSMEIGRELGKLLERLGMPTKYYYDFLFTTRLTWNLQAAPLKELLASAMKCDITMAEKMIQVEYRGPGLESRLQDATDDDTAEPYVKRIQVQSNTSSTESVFSFAGTASELASIAERYNWPSMPAQPYNHQAKERDDPMRHTPSEMLMSMNREEMRSASNFSPLTPLQKSERPSSLTIRRSSRPSWNVRDGAVNTRLKVPPQILSGDASSSAVSAQPYHNGIYSPSRVSPMPSIIDLTVLDDEAGSDDLDDEVGMVDKHEANGAGIRDSNPRPEPGILNDDDEWLDVDWFTQRSDGQNDDIDSGDSDSESFESAMEEFEDL